MSFIINTKKEIPTEDETKLKVISLAQCYGCYNEVKKLFDKYEQYYKEHKLDEKAKFQIAKSFIYDLSNIHIGLVAWLADENGNIQVNNIVVFTLVDVPEK